MQAWDEFISLLSSRFGKGTIDKWVRTLQIERFDACNLYLKSQDSFQALWVEEHIMPLAQALLKNNNGHTIKLHIISPDQQDKPKIESKSTPEVDLRFESDPLIKHCTFEQYIPSKSTQIPFEVFCRIIGFNPKTQTYEDPPQEKFNPIYLYGPSGMGKTHLLMAAATFLQLSGQKVFYVRAETFTNHVVNAIRSGQMQRFREAYRNVDVLIVDDIEVFGRKNATQEELFHTFNTLHTAGKQIILSAHVNPRLLEYIEERLISRFEWGITLPLEKSDDNADLSTLLQKRAQFYHIRLKRSLAEYLLKNFPSKASLSRAIEEMSTNCQTSILIQELDHIEPMLTKLIDQEHQKSLTPTKILNAVAEAFGIKVDDIVSSSQSRESTLPRQISMYLLRRELKLPYMKIGDIFDRDHSTVMTSVKQIKKALQNPDSEVAGVLNQLRNFLSSYSS